MTVWVRIQPFDKPFCAPERRVVRAVIELRHEEGAGRSTLTLNKSLIVESVDVHRGVGTPIEKANARFW